LRPGLHHARSQPGADARVRADRRVRRRLRDRNAYLEPELKAQERHLTNALKDKVVLEQKLAAQKPARRR